MLTYSFPSRDSPRHTSYKLSRDKPIVKFLKAGKWEEINRFGAVHANGKIIYPQTGSKIGKTGQRLNRVLPLDLIGLSKGVVVNSKTGHIASPPSLPSSPTPSLSMSSCLWPAQEPCLTQQLCVCQLECRPGSLAGASWPPRDYSESRSSSLF